MQSTDTHSPTHKVRIRIDTNRQSTKRLPGKPTCRFATVRPKRPKRRIHVVYMQFRSVLIDDAWTIQNSVFKKIHKLTITIRRLIVNKWLVASFTHFEAFPGGTTRYSSKKKQLVFRDQLVRLTENRDVILAKKPTGSGILKIQWMII